MPPAQQQVRLPSPYRRPSRPSGCNLGAVNGPSARASARTRPLPRTCTARRLLSTPAVKAVWLPPPWHAMATFLVLSCSSNIDLYLRCLALDEELRDFTGQLV